MLLMEIGQYTNDMFLGW